MTHLYVCLTCIVDLKKKVEPIAMTPANVKLHMAANPYHLIMPASRHA